MDREDMMSAVRDLLRDELRIELHEGLADDFSGRQSVRVELWLGDDRLSSDSFYVGRD